MVRRGFVTFFFFLFNVFLLLLLLVSIFLSVALSYAGLSPVARGAASDGMRITFSILLAFISYLFFIFKRLGFIFYMGSWCKICFIGFNSQLFSNFDVGL